MKKSILVLAIAYLFNSNVSFANNKIPFCKSLTVASEAEEVIVTVPQDERFVLLKLYADCDVSRNWHLDIDDEVLLAGTISFQVQTGNFFYKIYVHDFPDSCVVVPAGKTLTAVNENAMGYELKITFIGYLEQVNSGLLSDLNGDSRVDFEDFAIFADDWLAAP